MTISSTSSVHWRWNETDVSQFGSQINLGPVTGTVTLSYKAATGTFMVSPTIRASLSNGFHTPSGSLALIPLNVDELPKNLRVKFFVNHFSASNNVMSNTARNNHLCWGFVFNCSSGSTRADYNGTFYSIPFNGDTILLPKPINAGHVNAGYYGGSLRVGMITSSYSYHDWFIKHLSMTGSSLGGTDIEVWAESIGQIVAVNEPSFKSCLYNKMQDYEQIHWSGSTFSGKILDKVFLAFYYNPASSDYSAVNGAYVEIDGLQILKHPAGNGRELQPPPPTSSFYSGIQDPSAYGSTLTYWTVPSGALRTVSGNKITRINRFSGTSHFFGNAAASAPITSSTTVNGTSFVSALFSGSATSTFLTSSTSDGGYVSGSAFRTLLVANILTASLNNVSSYQNHVMLADTSGYWGLYFRNNGNGSGTLDAYGWVSSENTASANFKFGQPFVAEYWRDTNFLYLKMNNATTVSSSIAGDILVDSGSPLQMGSSGDSNSAWHLVELITTNGNALTSSTTVGAANYIAAKYGFPSASMYTVVGGEEW